MAGPICRLIRPGQTYARYSNIKPRRSYTRVYYLQPRWTLVFCPLQKRAAGVERRRIEDSLNSDQLGRWTPFGGKKKKRKKEKEIRSLHSSEARDSTPFFFHLPFVIYPLAFVDDLDRFDFNVVSFPPEKIPLKSLDRSRDSEPSVIECLFSSDFVRTRSG